MTLGLLASSSPIPPLLLYLTARHPHSASAFVLQQDYPFLRWTYPDHHLHKTAWVLEWWEEGSLQEWCRLVINYSKYMDKARASLFDMYGMLEGAVKLRHHRDHILDLVLEGNTDCLLQPFNAASEEFQLSSQVGTCALVYKAACHSSTQMNKEPHRGCTQHTPMHVNKNNSLCQMVFMPHPRMSHPHTVLCLWSATYVANHTHGEHEQPLLWGAGCAEPTPSAGQDHHGSC
jgi:hypothetical protein